MTMPRKTILTLLVATLVAGCSGRDDVTLSRIRHTGNGPDEFSIIPGKPLQTPADFASLPTPNPGGANLTDLNPLADGVAALGGNPAGGVASNGALVNHANRFGSTPAIRQTLAAEDKALRVAHGRVDLLRFLPGDDYVQAYRRDWLDAYTEERRLRNRGVVTPASPPPPE